jgi:hypothetical protein
MPQCAPPSPDVGAGIAPPQKRSEPRKKLLICGHLTFSEALEAMGEDGLVSDPHLSKIQKKKKHRRISFSLGVGRIFKLDTKQCKSQAKESYV